MSLTPGTRLEVSNRSSARPVNMREKRILRAVFLAGAVTDAIALLPMLLPSLAIRLWGVHDVSGSYRVAMGCAASLMLGWTILLVWASREPLERRAVAPLTLLVISGIVVAEVVGTVSGILDAWRLVPTWCLQAVLIILFVRASQAGRHAWSARQVTP